MAEKVTEKIICAACEAEVRDGSTFCYNCGEALEEEKPVEIAADEPEIINDEISAEPEPTAEAEEVVETPAAAKNDSRKNKMQTAAALRKQNKAYNRRPVEVVWEERSDSSLSFIIGSVVFTVIAFILFYLAFYLR